jgi:hypothetical protein
MTRYDWAALRGHGTIEVLFHFASHLDTILSLACLAAHESIHFYLLHVTLSPAFGVHRRLEILYVCFLPSCTPTSGEKVYGTHCPWITHIPGWGNRHLPQYNCN